MTNIIIGVVALVLVCMAHCAIAAPTTDEEWLSSSVAHLTADTNGDAVYGFDNFIASNPSTLVMFYAPWCGHCKNMKPAYIEAAKSVEGKLAAVDCTVHPAVCSKYGVRGYPTLKWFKDGAEGAKYEKGRSTADILKFMASPSVEAAAPPPPPPPEPFSTEPTDVAILTDADFTTYIESNPSTLVMFYAPWCGHCKHAKPEYIKAAKIVKDAGHGTLAAVDCTIQKATCGKQGIKGYPTIKYFRNGGVLSDFNGARSAAGFAGFMAAQAPVTPPVVDEAAAAAAADAAKHEEL